MMSLDSSAIITLCIPKILKSDYRGFILSADCKWRILFDELTSCGVTLATIDYKVQVKSGTISLRLLSRAEKRNACGFVNP